MKTIALLVALVLIAVPALTASAQEQRIRVGFSAMSGSMAWLWTAKEGGHFDQYGLKVDLVYVGGTAQLFQSMLAGEIAFGIGGGPAIIHANAQRRTIVGVAGSLNRMVMKVMAVPQIKTAADIRGKRIAITRYGTTTDFSARLFLKKWAPAMEKEAVILQVGSIPNVLASLSSGTSQLGALSPPAHLQAERLGFAELMDLSKQDIYYPYTYVTVSAPFLEKNGNLVRPFLAGAVEGIRRFKMDKLFAKRQIAKYLQVEDDKVLEETHQLFADLFERTPYIKREGLASLAQILAESDPKMEAVRIDSMVEDRFVRELESSGFIKTFIDRMIREKSRGDIGRWTKWNSKQNRGRGDMTGIILILFCVLSLAVAADEPAQAQESFYKGKTIRLIEAYSAGGGYDTYARLIARHLGKHIPGNPAIAVENMTGAGGLIAVNYLYNRAEPDGLTIGNWNGSLSLQQYMGLKGIEFDAPRFEWIGSAVRPTPICILARSSGVTSLPEWLKAKKLVKLGGMAPGTSISDDARILKEALGVPTQLVEGYKGGADIKLAAKQGEIDGACGLAWETQKVTWRQELETMNVVVQVGRKAHPELAKVPLAHDFAKTDDAKQLLRIGIQELGALGHAYTLPPKTRKNLVDTLRKAFEETMKDSEFLAEADKSGIVTNPVSGKELEEIVSGFTKLPADLLAKLKSSLLPKQ